MRNLSLCPVNAIEIAYFTDNEIESMIDGLPAGNVHREEVKETASTGQSRVWPDAPDLAHHCRSNG